MLLDFIFPNRPYKPKGEEDVWKDFVEPGNEDKYSQELIRLLEKIEADERLS